MGFTSVKEGMEKHYASLIGSSALCGGEFPWRGVSL